MMAELLMIQNLRISLDTRRVALLAHGKQTALVAFVVVCGGVMSAQSPNGPSLATPWQQVSFPGAFTHARTFPAVSNGYLISFQRTAVSPSPNKLAVAPLSSGVSVQVSFSLPNASRTQLEDANVTPDGQILLGGAYNGSSTSVASNFIAREDMTGNVTANFLVGDFTPERVCATSDGTFWALGQVLTGLKLGTYDLLRNYTSTGVMKASFLSTTSLPAQLPLDLHPQGSVFGTTPNQAFLACGTSAVAVYIGYPEYVWFQVQLSTGATQSWKVQPLTHGRMTGLALTSGNNVFASFSLLTGATSPVKALYQLQLGGAGGTASWQNIQDPSGAFSALLGADGTSLVHLRGNQPPILSPMIYWSSVSASLVADPSTRRAQGVSTGSQLKPADEIACEDPPPTCGDSRDALIAEYSTYNTGLSPVCSDFVNSGSTAYYSFSQLDYPSPATAPATYSWAILLNGLMNEPPGFPCTFDCYGLDFWTYTYDSLTGLSQSTPRRINSGYRCPSQNHAALGALHSQHMFGTAADLRNVTSSMTEWNTMHSAAVDASADYIEPITGPCKINCVHADWRNH